MIQSCGTFAFRQQGAAGDADQPCRHRAHRGAGVAAGFAGASEAQEIGKLAGELLRVALPTAAEHLKRVGGGLETAVNNYNKFVGSFERNVLTSARQA